VTKTVEAPSGKGAGDENFPVGSWLLPADLRPHVMAFYDFVRAADDIADHAELTGEEKLTRLDVFERGLLGDEEALRLMPKAERLRSSLAATGVTDRHALDLLKAFKQDATKTRYSDWQDLLGYCALSASPVGRYLLDLHREMPELYQYSDPLCDALQLLNHLQDCRDDFLTLDRVYVPRDSLNAVGIDVAALSEPASSSAMRSVLNNMLDGCDELLSRSAPLANLMGSLRLAAETAVIQEMAVTLAAKLRREDPLATRVELSKPRFLLAGLIGVSRLRWFGRRTSLPADVRREDRREQH
jgi:squalene synthase HpnC